MTIQVKATEQYFPVVLFIMLYKMILTFESVDEILKCDHSNENHYGVQYSGEEYQNVQSDFNSRVCGRNREVSIFKSCAVLISMLLAL